MSKSELYRKAVLQGERPSQNQWQIVIGQRVIKEFPTKEQCDTWLVEDKRVVQGDGGRWLDSTYQVVKKPRT